MEKYISNSIKYIGANHRSLDLFERQYVIPNGVSYNSYIIEDEKTVIMDTVDKRVLNEWNNNLEKELGDNRPDYLVISHLEPDHSSGISLITEKYPNLKVILSKRAADMLPQFINKNLADRCIIVNEGDIIDLGKHKLQFIMAPMVHWPEVMFTYEQTEKILFSADGFGKFGTLDTEEEWDNEARRYYINIVGKYGMQVQAVLRKAAGLEIKTICPLHGPVLKENLEHYITKYDIWSSYKPEDKGILIAYNSIHGNTANAIEKLVEIIKEQENIKVVTRDLARNDISKVVAEAFRYDTMIIASPTYDAGLFPPTEDFLRHLKHKNYQNRKIGIIENGSWAPMAAKCMQDILKDMKNLKIYEPIITIKTTMNEQTIDQMKELTKQIINN